MRFSLKTLGVAALAVALGTSAGAATLTINGGSAGTIPNASASQNNVLNALGIGPSLGGYFNSYITADEDTRVRVDLMGYEAAFANSFTIDGTTIGKPLGQMIAVGTLSVPLLSFGADISTGTFAFNFTSERSGGPDVVVNNGDANAGVVNFFASFGPGLEAATSGKVLWLFLDDGGKGANGLDDNHDDLVLRISVVPLPAGAVLLLTAMGGLAAVRRRHAQA